MVKFPIRVDTLTDANKLVAAATAVDGKVTVSDDDGHVVNAKSLLGCLYSMEFADIYLTCEETVAGHFDEFRI